MNVRDVPETNARMLQELLDLARRYVEEGKPLHAGQVYRRVIKAEPALQEPYLRLSGMYWEAGQEAEAERILRQGVLMCPENVDCRLMLGDQLLERGDFGRALECYTPLIAKKLPQVHVRIAIAHLRLGKTGEAEIEARKALVLETRLPRAREILGEVLLLTRRPAEAAAELKRALRLDPYNTRSHLLLGQALLQNRSMREALDAFQMAVDIEPENPVAWQYCGETLLRLRRLQEAEASLRHALELDPSSAGTSVLMGELYLQKGDMEQALTSFNNALRLHPGLQRAMDGRLHAKMRSVRLTERVGLFVLLCLFLTAFATGQTTRPGDEEAEALLRKGVSEYQSGMYREAAGTFDGLITAYPQNRRITAAMIMKGKSLYWLGDILESARVARTILTDHPGSQYAADAHFILGSIYRRIGRDQDAMAEFIRAWDAMVHPEPPHLAEDVIRELDSLATRSFTPLQLRSFIETTDNPECKAFLWLKVAENEAAADNTLRSRLAVDTLLILYPAHRGHPRVMALLDRITERSDVKLGVLLPLMADGTPTAAKELAGDILDGISYAIEQFAADQIQRITVTQVTRDTERDPAVAARAVRELAADAKVAAILGPIFSTSAVAAARAAEEQGIPLITPTANANGIAAIGNHIFQANPDYETRGRAMAQYAILRRGFKRLAVLAPSDAYGKFLAEGFGEEVHRLGARLIAVEWYERGASDLKKQLGAIRRAGMRAGADPQIAFGGKKKLGELMKLVGLGVSVRTLDSLMNKGATVSATKLLGPDAPEKLDSLGISVVFDDRNVDSLDYPVTSIDGIYLPISSPAEIGVVSSQVVYFNFQTQLLGSGEWNNLPELDANRRYCTGVLFESETDVDTLSGRFRFWVSGFMNRFKKRPSRHTLYGFDAAELVLEELRKGATTRQGLSRALADVKAFQGIHSKIGFSPGRVNTWLPIFQFDGRNIVRVDEIQAE